VASRLANNDKARFERKREFLSAKAQRWHFKIFLLFLSEKDPRWKLLSKRA